MIAGCAVRAEQFGTSSAVKRPMLDEVRPANYSRGNGAEAVPRKSTRMHLSFLANVYNHKARAFYHRHGVQLIDAAYEAHEEKGDVPVMITKHCHRFAQPLSETNKRQY